MVYRHGSLIEVDIAKNTRAFFKNNERDFFWTRKITVRKKKLLCNNDACDSYINVEFEINEDNGALIDLRNSRKM